MSSYYNPKSPAISDIPFFNEHNFAALKSKSINVIEIMDYDMLDVMNKGHIASMYLSSSNDVCFNGLKQKSMPTYNMEEKRVLNLDVKAMIAIRNSLAYHVYQLVQRSSTAQEMMNTLQLLSTQKGFMTMKLQKVSVS